MINYPEEWPAKPIVSRVLELMGNVINDGRNAVRGLRSSNAESDGLEQALSRIPQEFVLLQPIDFRVIVEGQPRPLHPIIRDEVYRIGREALANAFRHSRATGIEVQVEYADSHLRILVQDNGCGSIRKCCAQDATDTGAYRVSASVRKELARKSRFGAALRGNRS